MCYAYLPWFEVDDCCCELWSLLARKELQPMILFYRKCYLSMAHFFHQDLESNSLTELCSKKLSASFQIHQLTFDWNKQLDLYLHHGIRLNRWIFLPCSGYFYQKARLFHRLLLRTFLEEFVSCLKVMILLWRYVDNLLCSILRKRFQLILFLASNQQIMEWLDFLSLNLSCLNSFGR